MRKYGFLIQLIVLTLLTSTAALAQQIQVNRVTHQGNGCLPQTASHVMSPDNTTLSLLYSGMDVALTGGPRQTVQKSCWTKIDFTLAPNVQLVVSSVDIRGFWFLDNDKTGGIFRSVFFFQNGAARAMNNWWAPWNMAGGLRHTALGPVNENFTWTTPNTILHISPCGGQTTLNMLNQVNISTAEGSNGQATFDSLDSDLINRVKIQVVNCQYKFKPYPGPATITPERELLNNQGPVWQE